MRIGRPRSHGEALKPHERSFCVLCVLLMRKLQGGDWNKLGRGRRIISGARWKYHVRTVRWWHTGMLPSRRPGCGTIADRLPGGDKCRPVLSCDQLGVVANQHDPRPVLLGAEALLPQRTHPQRRLQNPPAVLFHGPYAASPAPISVGYSDGRTDCRDILCRPSGQMASAGTAPQCGPLASVAG